MISEHSEHRLPSTSPSVIITTLLGAFQILVDEQIIRKFHTNKSRALIAYLLLAQGRPVLRSALTALLWPGYTAKSAQANLRQAVADLRKTFATVDLFHTDFRTVQLRLDPAQLRCDALRFDELLDACDAHQHSSHATCPACRERLTQALALYQGPFLENLPAVDSGPFNAWLTAQRERYAARAAQSRAILAGAIALQTQPPSNLPTPLTTLIGRQQELIELTDKLHHPVYRCLTLVGPGGIGKTRLALALGAQQRAAFPDGVWFVDLGALATDATPTTNGMDDEATRAHLYDRLAAAILTARELTLQSATRPTTQLLTYLQDKTLLLILDNFEHLSAGAGLLAQLLQEAPTVRILVTSRQRLELQGQQLYNVIGLPWPDESATTAMNPTELATRYPSLQLFLERAALTLVTLPSDRPTLTAMTTICQVVEGVPLALELAATLLERHSLSAIPQMISANYQILQSNFQDLPPRQRSAQAVLFTAWSLLTLREAETLARCAVFHGGFTLAAAQSIASATLAELEACCRKSLLQPSSADPAVDPGAGRYRMHELVRQFAAVQLARQNAVAQQTYDRHATYYTNLVASWQPAEEAERRFCAAVQADLSNVETAWAWTLAADQIAQLLPAVEGLVEFYEMVGNFHAAAAHLQRSIAMVRDKIAAVQVAQPSTSVGRADNIGRGNDLMLAQSRQRLLAALLVQLGYVNSIGLAQQAEAKAAATEALALAEGLNDTKQIVRSYHVLSAVAYAESQYKEAQALGEKGVQLARAQGLRREEAMCLSGTGMAATADQDYATALRYLPQALAIAHAINDTRKALLFRNQLGVTYRELGDFAQALHCFEENLPITRARNDAYNILLAVGNLGLLRLLLGDYTAAFSALEEACQRAQALGEKRLLNDCLAVMGHLQCQQGDAAGAAATCRGVLAHPQASLSAQQAAWLTLIDLHAAQGAWAEVQNACSQLLAISQIPAALGIQLIAQGGLAVVVLAQQGAAAALAALEPLLARFDETAFDTFYSAARFLLPAYQILVANGDGRAAAILQQAWSIILRYAEKISDPDLRHSFLANVSPHRQVQQLIEAPQLDDWQVKDLDTGD